METKEKSDNISSSHHEMDDEVDPREVLTQCSSIQRRTFVMDETPPPPETTRPTPKPAPWNTSYIRKSARSLHNIMQEQERERTQHQTDELRIVEFVQEEELMNLALERSLSEALQSTLHSSNRSFSSINEAHNSNRSFSSIHEAEFARKVEEESERTEIILESPHSSSKGSVSHRRLRDSLIRGNSQNSSSSWCSFPDTPKRVQSYQVTGKDHGLAQAARHSLSQQETDEVEQAVRESQLLSQQRLENKSYIKPGVTDATGTVRPAAKKPNGIADVPELSDYDFSGANLTEEELRQIQLALAESDHARGSNEDEDNNVKQSAAKFDHHLSEEETAAIEKAIREADAEEEAKSLQLALQMLEEERNEQMKSANRAHQGNVRVMTRSELEDERAGRVGAFLTSEPPLIHPLEEAEQMAAHAGYRINSSMMQQWVRRDQNFVIGPNNEVRTKHDVDLQGQANAHRLGLNSDDHGDFARVGNSAYNSFMQSVKKNKKGVAAHGTGRAGSDTDGTKSGAMDQNVRLQITKAINNGWIERCNGAVKEGKEAVIYHADKGEYSEGFDVAVKVFKRIELFRGRGAYVDGDPRYAGNAFKNVSAREQLELWAEKEYRNIMRANRAGVPVATPLFQKENVLFMRFLGTDGWPAPQLRELDLRKGSKRWVTLYLQVMEAIRK